MKFALLPACSWLAQLALDTSPQPCYHGAMVHGAMVAPAAAAIFW